MAEKKPRKHKWIRQAVKHPGAFTASAERAGKGVHEYAEEHKHDSGTLGNRARLALTFEKMGRRHKAKSRYSAKGVSR